MKRTLALVVCFALFAAACGSDADSDATTTTTSTTTPAPTTTSPPDDPDRLVLLITAEGGFAPVEFLVNRLPRYALYADGTLLSPGPQAAIFPGPIMPSVQSATLDGDQLDDVMTLIEAIGLPAIDREIDNTASNFVADATTTIATYFDATGGEHIYGAYAVGIVDNASDATLNLNALLTMLDRLTFEGAVGEPYEPDRIQIRLGDGQFVDRDLSETLPWPLEINPDEFEVVGEFRFPCATLDGAAAEVAIATFADGKQSTLWDFEGTEYQFFARPLLPGEVACVN